MTKTLLKTVGILSLIIVFLIALVGLIFGGSAALWLRTYQVFTQQTPVAQINISKQENDGNGTYANVQIRMINKDSALAAIYGQDNTANQSEGAEQDYKVYGDTIYISGPIVKFRDPLILINFKTIYKIGKLYGRYDLNNEQETNENPLALAQSSYDLNGGFADWKPIFDNINANNLMGKFYSLFVDTTQLSSAGIFIADHDQQYTVYMTNLGFLWEKN